MKKMLLFAMAAAGFTSATASSAQAQSAQIAIRAVYDATGAGEYTDGKTSTTYAYTSPPVHVIYDEYFVGGRNRISRLGGQQVFLSSTNTNLCGSDFHVCRSGETVTGFRNDVNLGQLGNGRTFYIQDTSAYYPYPTGSAQIVIR